MGLAGTGCTSHRPHCTAPGERVRVWEAQTNSVPHSVSVVEFDDQGELWDPAQLHAAVEHLERIEQAHPQGVLTIVFVHGWQASPTWDQGRLAWFEDLVKGVATFSMNAAREQHAPPQPVAGVFVGWRGASTKLPVIKHLTFWDRKMAARHLASVTMTEALVSLVARREPRQSSKRILIGHSLGAMIVERTAGAFLCSYLLSEPEVDVTPSDVNLTVLVNPASEALHTKQVIDLLKRRRVHTVRIDPDGTETEVDRPFLVFLSSEKDMVAKRIFPIGQGIGSLFSRYRAYEDPEIPRQRYFSTHTAGFVPYLISHRAEMDADRGYALIPRPGRYNDTPFWVVQMEKEISSGHSDIDSPEFLGFLGYLLELADVYKPESQFHIRQRPWILEPVPSSGEGAD